MKDMHCVHLDFHTTDEIPGIGSEFDKEEFKQAFNEMCNRLPNLFNEMIERDEEPQQDENNE